MPVQDCAPLLLRQHALVFVPQFGPRHSLVSVSARHMRAKIDAAHAHHRTGVLPLEAHAWDETSVNDIDVAHAGELANIEYNRAGSKVCDLVFCEGGCERAIDGVTMRELVSVEIGGLGGQWDIAGGTY